MNNWEILGIEPTNDIEIIKSAYARKSKIYHPETNPVLLSERFAFYVYRNILETLDSPYINKDLLFQWIAWGLAEEHTARISDIYHHAATHGVRISASQTQFTIKVFRSPIVFELLSYLLAKESTPPVYSEVLNDVYETFMNNQWCCDEIRNLYNAINNRM